MDVVKVVKACNPLVAKELVAFISETDCDQTAISLPPVTFAVLLIAK
jgi:hypothetical protein